MYIKYSRTSYLNFNAYNIREGKIYSQHLPLSELYYAIRKLIVDNRDLIFITFNSMSRELNAIKKIM